MKEGSVDVGVDFEIKAVGDWSAFRELNEVGEADMTVKYWSQKGFHIVLSDRKSGRWIEQIDLYCGAESGSVNWLAGSEESEKMAFFDRMDFMGNTKLVSQGKREGNKVKVSLGGCKTEGGDKTTTICDFKEKEEK